MSEDGEGRVESRIAKQMREERRWREDDRKQKLAAVGAGGLLCAL